MDHRPEKSVLVSLGNLRRWPCRGQGKWTSWSGWPNTVCWCVCVCVCILSLDHYFLPIVPGLWIWGCVDWRQSGEVTYITLLPWIWSSSAHKHTIFMLTVYWLTVTCKQCNLVHVLLKWI